MASPPTPVASFGWKQVLAWRLANQHLLDDHTAKTVEESASSTIGVQAQVASSADQSLAIRVPGTRPQDVADALWERRTLVKTWAMRGTLHLLSATDYPHLIAALVTRDQWRRAPWLKYFGVTIDQVDGIVAAIDEALAGRCLTRQELADAIAAEHGPAMRGALLGSWGSMLKPAAFLGVLCSGPSRGQNVTFQRPVDWIGRWEPVDPDDGLQWVIAKYLHAYGPATADGFASWWGAARTRAKRMLQSTDSDFVPVEIEGQPAWANRGDLGAIEATKPVRGSVRLLAGFDTYIMGCHPRDRVVPPPFLPRVSRTAGWISPVVLVDGVARGVWRSSHSKSGTEIRVEPFEPLSTTVRRRIEREARRLEPCLGTITDVRFEPIEPIEPIETIEGARADEPA